MWVLYFLNKVVGVLGGPYRAIIFHEIKYPLEVIFDIVTVQLGLVHNYDKNVWHVLDTTLKHKDRLNFYPCIADAVLDVSDHTCHKFI